MNASALYLLHTRPDPRRLAVWAASHRVLPANQGDMGYALHGLLLAAFGDAAPQPFAYEDETQALLAYTAMTPDDMARRVALADPEAVEALGLCATAGDAGYRMRQFPTHWPAGHVLRFQVRVRPIVREGKTGRERDAFLVAADRADGAPLDRQTIYVQWLKEQLGVRETGPREAWQGAVEIVDANLERFRLLDVLRQTQRTTPEDARKRRAVGGPDAVIQGHLRVTDPASFTHLLTRGIGRHRAFGFGMLMLRPAA